MRPFTGSPTRLSVHRAGLSPCSARLYREISVQSRSFLRLEQTRTTRCPDGGIQQAVPIASIHCQDGQSLAAWGSSGAHRHYHSLLERSGLWRRSYARNCIARDYSAESNKGVTADEYILELQDLYEIAKDELEIAIESTDASTVYAASDRDSLREAFDDLEHAYAVYTGAQNPPASAGEHEANQSGEEEGNNKRATTLNSNDIPLEIREEIKRRVGQRIRELRNAVENLEERAKSE